MVLIVTGVVNALLEKRRSSPSMFTPTGCAPAMPATSTSDVVGAGEAWGWFDGLALPSRIAEYCVLGARPVPMMTICSDPMDVMSPKGLEPDHDPWGLVANITVNDEPTGAVGTLTDPVHD